MSSSEDPYDIPSVPRFATLGVENDALDETIGDRFFDQSAIQSSFQAMNTDGMLWSPARAVVASQLIDPAYSPDSVNPSVFLDAINPSKPDDENSKPIIQQTPLKLSAQADKENVVPLLKQASIKPSSSKRHGGGSLGFPTRGISPTINADQKKTRRSLVEVKSSGYGKVAVQPKNPIVRDRSRDVQPKSRLPIRSGSVDRLLSVAKPKIAATTPVPMLPVPKPRHTLRSEEKEATEKIDAISQRSRRSVATAKFVWPTNSPFSSGRRSVDSQGSGKKASSTHSNNADTKGSVKEKEAIKQKVKMPTLAKTPTVPLNRSRDRTKKQTVSSAAAPIKVIRQPSSIDRPLGTVGTEADFLREVVRRPMHSQDSRASSTSEATNQAILSGRDSLESSRTSQKSRRSTATKPFTFSTELRVRERSASRDKRQSTATSSTTSLPVGPTPNRRISPVIPPQMDRAFKNSLRTYTPPTGLTPLRKPPTTLAPFRFNQLHGPKDCLRHEEARPPPIIKGKPPRPPSNVSDGVIRVQKAATSGLRATPRNARSRSTSKTRHAAEDN